MCEYNKLLNIIDGYLKLLITILGITPKAFGLTVLRKWIQKRDHEGVLKGLKILLRNMQNRLTALQGKWMLATLPQT